MFIIWDLTLSFIFRWLFNLCKYWITLLIKMPKLKMILSSSHKVISAIWKSNAADSLTEFIASDHDFSFKFPYKKPFIMLIANTYQVFLIRAENQRFDAELMPLQNRKYLILILIYLPNSDFRLFRGSFSCSNEFPIQTKSNASKVPIFIIFKKLYLLIKFWVVNAQERSNRICYVSCLRI